MTGTAEKPDLRQEVDANPVWYHTMELAPGITTPGWFDARPVSPLLPWPDINGQRCLDIGTYDGFFAFEMERRGAAEVVAIDIGDHNLWDWPPDVRYAGPDQLAKWAGKKGEGFEIAHRALGSKVKKIEMSIYDLSPERVGMFDFVLCGSLLLHLRDPLRALEAVRSITKGKFLSAETIDLVLTFGVPRFPIARLNGVGQLCQWWIPSAKGHRQMVTAAGFAIERHTRPYVVPYGPAHPTTGAGVKTWVRKLGQQATARGWGVPHAAVLAHPSV